MSQTQELDQRIAAVPIFASLSGRHRKRLLNQSRVVEHQADHEIATEGLGSLAMHVVLTGSVGVTLRNEEVRTLGPGDYFGEISLIDGQPRSATVTTLEPASTLAVPHTAFQQLLDDEPSVARTMLRILCQRLREAESA